MCSPPSKGKIVNWPTDVSYNPEGVGGGALKERFDRGVSPLPSNPDSVFKAAHD